MSWALAVFGCFSVLVVSALVFLFLVYRSELKRENSIRDQYLKEKDKVTGGLQNMLQGMDGNMPVVYLTVPNAPKKQKQAKDSFSMPDIKTDKSKKNIN